MHNNNKDDHDDDDGKIVHIWTHKNEKYMLDIMSSIGGVRLAVRGAVDANVPFSNLLQIFKIRGICTGLYIHFISGLMVPHTRHAMHTHRHTETTQIYYGKIPMHIRIQDAGRGGAAAAAAVPDDDDDICTYSTVYSLHNAIYCSIDYVFRNVTWLIWCSHYGKFI